MLTFVVGENNTGKSAYAESLVEATTSGKRYYIATMIPYGEEGKQRVAKHIKMRAHLGMITIEDPFLEKADMIEDHSVVLLEDLSNLVANRMFADKQVVDKISGGQNSSDKQMKDEPIDQEDSNNGNISSGLHKNSTGVLQEYILRDLSALNERVDELIIVSIGKLSANGYDEETAKYINTLNELNKRLLEVADSVVEMK